MANAKVTDVTRKSVTLTWEMVPGACAYSIARAGPFVEGEDRPQPIQLAVVYARTFCDATVEPDSRYQYTLDRVPAPDAAEPVPDDIEQIRARTLPATVYADSREFFTDALSVWYCRNTDTGGVRWCPEWWLHLEAAARVDALWMAWEQCNLDEGVAPAAWWVNYSDPNMRELFDQGGTFVGCTQERGHHPQHGPLPDGMVED